MNEDRLCFVSESGNAYAKRAQTQDVEDEQAKLRQADAIVFQFPIWWFSFPAILKGWVDRVFAYGLAYGYKDAGNQHRYGEGGFAGKRYCSPSQLVVLLRIMVRAVSTVR